MKYKVKRICIPILKLIMNHIVWDDLSNADTLTREFFVYHFLSGASSELWLWIF